MVSRSRWVLLALVHADSHEQILTNFVFVAACTFLLFLQRFLYGRLRPIEIEQLYEKAWFAVTETCLAMTIFRGEIGAWFLVMFFALLAGKVWGWIGEGRVETLEQQPPRNAALFHTRLAASLLLSVVFDTYMLDYVVQEVLQMARPDMMVMFGFEFAVLSISSLSTLARYAISLVEILIVRGQKYRRAEEIRKERREAREAQLREQSTNNQGESSSTQAADGTTTIPAMPQPPTQTGGAATEEHIDDAEIEVEGWEEKGRWIFYLDLTTDFLKLVIYLSFFFILLIFYGLPIHIMRDVFLTCRSFFKRIADFLRYRTATKDMDERYPDATAEEVGREEVCIICREEMRVAPRQDATAAAGDANGQQQSQQPPQRPRRTTNAATDRMRPKKLPCGHILHFACLRSWLERQQICPTCRRPVLPTHRIQVGGAAAPDGRGGFLQGFQDGMNAHPRNQQGQHGPANEQGGGQRNQNRGRIYQFGPLRIGVGAGNNNVFEDLAQRIHDGDVGPIPNRDGNNANGPQQYGFGFGFGRPRNRDRHRHANSGALVTEALQAAERRIVQEIEDLRLASSELNMVRMLQAELNRLRALRQQNTSTASGSTPATMTSAPLTGTTGPATATATGFVADSRQNVLTAGSESLPPGLTLPEGWTMMPLQRMQPGMQLPTIGLGQPVIGAAPAVPPSMLPVAQGFSFGFVQNPQPPLLPGAGFAMGSQGHPGVSPGVQQAQTSQQQPETQTTPAQTTIETSEPVAASVTTNGPSNVDSTPSNDLSSANIDEDVLEMFRENARHHQEALREHHGLSDAELAARADVLSNIAAPPEDISAPYSAGAHQTADNTLGATNGSAAANGVPNLPIWGSEPVIPPTVSGNDATTTADDQTSTGAPSISTDRDNTQPLTNGDHTHPPINDQEDTEIAQSERRKESSRYTATVEDLVEDPN